MSSGNVRRLVALGAAAAWAGFAAGILPPPVMTVSAWAEEKRIVAEESGSPYPGPWKNARTPYLVEPMDCMGFDHPCRDVTLKFSAQTAKSEACVNFAGYVIDHQPSPMLTVLPSLEEAQKYNKVKVQPTVEATPVLRTRIRATNSRDEDSSTALFKRYPGGFWVLTGANSSKGLQMISARSRIYDEWSEFPEDTDGRGEPTFQAESRGKAWTERGSKSVYASTPAIKGSCRISAKYAASDMRRFYVPCPSCGDYQVLLWKNLDWDEDIMPHGAYFTCAGHGCIIHSHSKSAMVAAGVWIKTYPGDGEANPAPPEAFPAEQLEQWRARVSAGRQPGFAIWQAYSPFVPWDNTVAEWLDAQGNPRKIKTFTQQALGEDYEEKGEAPDHERLFDRREPFPARRLPPGVLFTTGAVDVQGDRLEYAVYGYDRGASSWLIDAGVLAGDPDQPEVWKALDEVMARRYLDAWGRPWAVEAWGIDTGFKSQTVYRYARGHAASGRVFALDGRPGWKLPSIGLPKTVDVDFAGKKIGSVQLWPVGTWDLKSEIYGALRYTLQGPDDATGTWPVGAIHFPSDLCTREFFQQLTAEFLADRAVRTGYTVKEWRKSQARNEQLDMAVYSRALAHHLSDLLTEAEWDALATARLGRPQDVQASFDALWTPGLATQQAQAAPQPAPTREASAPDAPAAAPAARDRSAGGVVVRGGGTVSRG